MQKMESEPSPTEKSISHVASFSVFLIASLWNINESSLLQFNLSQSNIFININYQKWQWHPHILGTQSPFNHSKTRSKAFHTYLFWSFHVRSKAWRWPCISHKRALIRNLSCLHLDLGCLAFRTGENNFLLLKPPSLWCFMATWAD